MHLVFWGCKAQARKWLVVKHARPLPHCARNVRGSTAPWLPGRKEENHVRAGQSNAANFACVVSLCCAAKQRRQRPCMHACTRPSGNTLVQVGAELALWLHWSACMRAAHSSSTLANVGLMTTRPPLCLPVIPLDSPAMACVPAYVPVCVCARTFFVGSW